jgi:hypothetical protein
MSGYNPAFNMYIKNKIQLPSLHSYLLNKAH